MERSNNLSPASPLKVVWINYFPIEYLPDLPYDLQNLPRLHPGTWQRVLWEQFQQNPNLDLDILVLRSHFSKSMVLTRGNTRFHCIKTPGGLRSASLYWLDTFIISKKLAQINPHLVHAWGTEFGAASIATRLKWPSLITMQGILTWYGDGFPLNFHQKLSRYLEVQALRKATIATAESSFALSYLKKRYPQLEILQAEHAPHPMFASVQRSPQLSPIRFIALGSFIFRKGADIIIAALNTLKSELPFELLWIGGGDREFKAQIQSNTSPDIWKRITFHDHLEPAKIVQEFQCATILLHGARADNSPNAVKEAVVAGLPVVASDTGGIPDYLFYGKNGLLFKAGDIDDCRRKIEEALNHPLFSKGQIDPETHKQVRHYLSASRMAENFLNAYKVARQLYGAQPKR